MGVKGAGKRSWGPKEDLGGPGNCVPKSKLICDINDYLPTNHATELNSRKSNHPTFCFFTQPFDTVPYLLL